MKYYNNDKIISNSHTEHFQLLLVLNEFKGTRIFDNYYVNKVTNIQETEMFAVHVNPPTSNLFNVLSVCIYV